MIKLTDLKKIEKLNRLIPQYKKLMDQTLLIRVDKSARKAKIDFMVELNDRATG